MSRRHETYPWSTFVWDGPDLTVTRIRAFRVAGKLRVASELRRLERRAVRQGKRTVEVSS